MVPRGGDPHYLLVRLDYALWASTLLVLASLYYDLREHRRASILSTLLLEVSGFLLVASARAASLVHSLMVGPGYLCVGCGLADPGVALYAYPLALAGGVLGVASMALSRLLGGPLVFSTGATLDDVLGALSPLLSPLLERPELLAFAAGFAVRLLPEIHWWPRLVGYDTVEYVAHLKDFAERPSAFGTYFWMVGPRNVPPLLDWLLYPLALLVDPWYLFKLFPPVAYGVLVSLVTALSRRVLGVGTRRSLLVALLAPFSVPLLRMSWDLHRQLLATVLFLAALLVLDSGSGTRRHATAASLLLLSSLASEVGAAYAIILSAYAIVRERRRLRVVSLYALLASASYALVAWYTGRPADPHPVTGLAPPLVGGGLGWEPSVLAYLLITLGPLAPLLAAGLERCSGRAKYTTYTLAALLTLSVLPWVAPHLAVPGEWDRTLMAATALALPIALPRIAEIGRRELAAAVALLLALPGFCATAHPSLHYYVRDLFSPLNRMPWGLVPSPYPAELFDEALEVAGLVGGLDLAESPLVTWEVWCRFLHLELRHPRTSELVCVPREPTPEDLWRVLSGLNRTRAYVLLALTTPERFGESVEAFLSGEHPPTEGVPPPPRGLGVETAEVYGGRALSLLRVEVVGAREAEPADHRGAGQR